MVRFMVIATVLATNINTGTGSAESYGSAEG